MKMREKRFFCHVNILEMLMQIKTISDMRILLFGIVCAHVTTSQKSVVEPGTEKPRVGKTEQQTASESFEFGKEDDVTFSSEQLVTDKLLASLFPGNKEVKNKIIHANI